MPAQQYQPMMVGDLPEESNAEESEEEQQVGVRRTAWQFAKMVIVLGVAIGLIALVTSLPHMSKKAETIDTKSVIGEYASDVCGQYQGVGHVAKKEACCAKACGQFCGTPNCQLGPPGYKACCATFFNDAEGQPLYCGNGQMAPCWVTTTPAPTTPAPTQAPLEVVKGEIVASTSSGESAVIAAKANNADELACRQALTQSLHQPESAVTVSNVVVRSSGDSWSGGGIVKFDYAISAKKGDAVFKQLQEGTLPTRQSIANGMNKAFTDAGINTVVSGVTIPQPAIHTSATSV